MIVIARKYGQLGNRLFLFAHLIAAARHYGVELRNPCFGDYAELFPSTRKDLWCRYDRHLTGGEGVSECHRSLPSQRLRSLLMGSLAVSTKLLDQTRLRRYPAHVIRLGCDEECDLTGDRFADAVASGRPVLLQGWLFRSGHLWQQHADAIRAFFQLSPDRRQRIETILARARRDSDCVIGVHIRRGDYATFLGGKYYYADAAYASWMHQIREQLPTRDVTFLVCSHERLDDRAFEGLNIVRGPGSAIEDMYALAKADWMIGPPSTFTAWAAFMGDKPRLEMPSVSHAPQVPASLTQSAPPSDTIVLPCSHGASDAA